MTKNIEIDYRDKHGQEENREIGSWNHIITAYEIDVYSFLLERHIPSITEQHVYPDKVKKMKVKLMMQVFSKKMCQFIDLLARTGGTFYCNLLYSKCEQLKFNGNKKKFI